jgi:hypothetical protein
LGKNSCWEYQLEHLLRFLKKSKNRSKIWSSSTIPGYILEGN